MKTTLVLVAALAALTITATAQVSVTTVDGWAVSQSQKDHVGPSNWDGFSLTFRPSQWAGGTVWGWWGYGDTSFAHSEARRCDFIVLEYDGGCRSSGTQVYAEKWLLGWYTPTAPTPPAGVAWAAYRVDVRGGVPAVALVAYGHGDAPWSASYYEALLPAL